MSYQTVQDREGIIIYSCHQSFGQVKILDKLWHMASQTQHSQGISLATDTILSKPKKKKENMSVRTPGPFQV
ncbi:Uncharacterized protein TCM_014038 [Theobroma cacao]|uniref:Uncharacterized protein n=1 Tax=Theobroma cacao TaxID=3641 RepID=A0A061FYC2_THECC|nr:Uncharacterized protein TCM_014038 [Theobroma cacao]